MSEDKLLRDKRGRFPKGISGNKLGRPRREARALLPSQYDSDFLRAMEKELVVTGPNGEHIARPAVEMLLEQTIMDLIKKPCLKETMELLRTYRDLLEANRQIYLDEESRLKMLENMEVRATEEKLAIIKRLIAYNK